MNNRITKFYSALIISLCVILLLVTGSSILTMPLDSKNSIPLGTFITWAGMVALPLTLYWGIKELKTPTKKLNKLLAWILKIIIVLGILWVPISFSLAGNWSFTFTEKESFQGGQLAMLWFCLLYTSPSPRDS